MLEDLAAKLNHIKVLMNSKVKRSLLLAANVEKSIAVTREKVASTHVIQTNKTVDEVIDTINATFT